MLSLKYNIDCVYLKNYLFDILYLINLLYNEYVLFFRIL